MQIVRTFGCGIAPVVAALLAIASPAIAQSALPEWSLVGHAQPVATLRYVGPDGQLDPRTWTLGDDGLVVAWDTSSWGVLAWRRIDGARAIGGLYEGDVVVETPDGVHRLQPGSLLDSTARAAYPGAELPAPADLNEAAATPVAIPPARMPWAVVPIHDGIAVLERAAWCTLTLDPALTVTCVEDAGQHVLGVLQETVLVCVDGGSQVQVAARSLSDGGWMASAPASSCPDAGVTARGFTTAVADGLIYDWDGAELTTTAVGSARAATTPLSWSRERVVLVERFDGTCATRRRMLVRHAGTVEQIVWRGDCEGDEDLLPLWDTVSGEDGAAVVRPLGEGVLVEGFSRSGESMGRWELEELPSRTARLELDGPELVVADADAAALGPVVVGRIADAELVRDGGALRVVRGGVVVGMVTMLGRDAVVTAPGSVLATAGVTRRIAVRDGEGARLLPEADLSGRGAEQLLRSLAASPPARTVRR